MLEWLAIAAALPLGAAASNHPPARRPIRIHVALPSRPRQANFNIPREFPIADPPSRSLGMLVHDNLAPNAVVGLGLAKLPRRGRPGPDFRIGRGEAHMRKPGVTFIYKF